MTGGIVFCLNKFPTMGLLMYVGEAFFFLLFLNPQPSPRWVSYVGFLLKSSPSKPPQEAVCGGQGPHTPFQRPALSGGPCLDKFPLRLREKLGLPLQRKPGSWSKQVANLCAVGQGLGEQARLQPFTRLSSKEQTFYLISYKIQFTVGI